MKSRKSKIFPGILIAAILCTALASFASYAKFTVLNPFTTVNGLAKLMLTDVEHIEIQAYPKVMIAKPNASLNDYMEKQGYV